MIRKSTTEWQGDGPSGSGSLNTESGALQAQPYSFKTRFQAGHGGKEDGKAVTNPEELLGAALAACFSMTVAFILTEAGHAPKRLKVTSAVDISKVGAGFGITSIALDLEAQVEGIAIEQFRELTGIAKTNCPVSKALSATPISLTARLA
jgi:osmotically inducible protein OsmC